MRINYSGSSGGGIVGKIKNYSTSKATSSVATKPKQNTRSSRTRNSANIEYVPSEIGSVIGAGIGGNYIERPDDTMGAFEGAQDIVEFKDKALDEQKSILSQIDDFTKEAPSEILFDLYDNFKKSNPNESPETKDIRSDYKFLNYLKNEVKDFYKETIREAAWFYKKKKSKSSDSMSSNRVDTQRSNKKKEEEAVDKKAYVVSFPVYLNIQWKLNIAGDKRTAQLYFKPPSVPSFFMSFLINKNYSKIDFNQDYGFLFDENQIEDQMPYRSLGRKHRKRHGGKNWFYSSKMRELLIHKKLLASANSSYDNNDYLKMEYTMMQSALFNPKSLQNESAHWIGNYKNSLSELCNKSWGRKLLGAGNLIVEKQYADWFQLPPITFKEGNNLRMCKVLENYVNSNNLIYILDKSNFPEPLGELCSFVANLSKLHDEAGSNFRDKSIREKVEHGGALDSSTGVNNLRPFWEGFQSKNSGSFGIAYTDPTRMDYLIKYHDC